MKQVKRKMCILLMCLLLSAVCPIHAFAAEPIEPERKITFTIAFRDGDTAIPKAEFRVFRVADVDENARMTLTKRFSGYKDTVSGLDDLNDLPPTAWSEVAATLSAYVRKDALPDDRKGATDGEGNLSFDEMRTGLYLVIGNRVMTEEGYACTPEPFLTILPYREESGKWNYEPAVAPKYQKEIPSTEPVSRRVLKIWDDSGYESIRPAQVEVQLLKDGEVFDTQSLSRENNWRYEWNGLDAACEWKLVEKEIKGYAVTITFGGSTFTVTNKYTVRDTDSNVSVSKRITGDKPGSDSSFTFVFAAEKYDNPMPEGSKAAKKEITITGAGSKDVGTIRFTEAGKYAYTVREKKESASGYTYDDTVYTVTFDVTERDGALTVAKTIKDDEGKTVSAVEFTNTYTKTTGGGGGGGGGGTLPQTGVLWWPVPALFCAGLVFIIIGVLLRRRCGE